VFDLLLYLIRNRDRVISKDELIDAIWQGRVISEAALSTCVSAARRAVGDRGGDQRLIRTAPKRGFRFVGKIDDDPVPQTMQAEGEGAGDTAAAGPVVSVGASAAVADPGLDSSPSKLGASIVQTGRMSGAKASAISATRPM
jgi:DNA-binding winged helix-turn-helix (wHTH) protein